MKVLRRENSVKAGIQKHKQKRRQKHLWRRGSFTVEASFLFPIIILLMSFMILLSIRLCRRVETQAENLTMIQEIDSLEDFWKIKELKAVVDTVKEEW